MDVSDLKKCMKKLRVFHEMKLKVGHEFDIFGQIEFYEQLWEGVPSVYRDYLKTKEHVFSLKSYIEKYAGEKVLTHIDAVPDNFLFSEKDGQEDVRLIDWEYAECRTLMWILPCSVSIRFIISVKLIDSSIFIFQRL